MSSLQLSQRMCRMWACCRAGLLAGAVTLAGVLENRRFMPQMYGDESTAGSEAFGEVDSAVASDRLDEWLLRASPSSA